MTATNIPNVERLLYSRILIKPNSGTFNVTMTVSHGSKSASITTDVSDAESTTWFPDLKGGNGDSITWTIKNNSGSNMRASNVYCDIYIARSYSIEFDKQGGNGGDSNISEIWHYFSYPNVTPPTRSGYKFLGYFDASTGGTKYFNANGTATKSTWDKRPDDYLNPTIKLYAQWEVAEQSVNVTAGAGVSSVYLSTNSTATSGSASGSKFNSGATVYGFAKLARGYQHKSNWTLISGTEDTEGAIYRVASQTVGTTTVNFGTVNAELGKYNINYYDQDGDDFVAMHESGYKQQHTYNSITILDHPTRAGHSFLGWHKLADCSDEVVTQIGGQEYTSAFNLYAKWTHNVLIEAGDGISKVYLSTSAYDLTGVQSGTEYENGTQVYGYAVLEKGYNAPPAWTLVHGTSNGEGAVYRIGSGIVTQDGYDFEVVNALPNHYYVMFDDGSYAVATYGDNLPTIAQENLPTKTGYTFLGFFDAEEGEGIKYYNADGTGAHAWDKTEITTLYPRFEVTEFVIEYQLDGGEVEGNPETYTYFDDDITLVNPTKNGYTFVGWTGTNLDQLTMEVVIEKGSVGNKSYTAHFTQNEYTVTIGEQEFTVVYDNEMPQITAPTQIGYTFHGYFDAKDGEGTKYYNADGTSARTWDKTENAELYPYFTANYYTVIVNENEYVVQYDHDMPLLNSEDVLSQIGYTFDGYYYKTDGEAVKYYNADGKSAHIWNINDDSTLIPHFTINQYSISFNSNGGSDVEEIKQDYGTTVIIPQNPEKIGYSFSGWYLDEEFTEIYEFTTIPAENITLYAKWIAKEYTVTLDEEEITATYDSEMPTIIAPIQIGYTFHGYFDKENGEGTQYYNEDGTSAHIWDKTQSSELYTYWSINSYKVEISNAEGTKSVYTSLSPIAKSGNESGYKYLHNTKVYAFAVLAGGYTAPSDWVLVQGISNTDGAIYYIGEATVFGTDYDFSDHYETAGIPNKCIAVFDGERAEEIVFGQMLEDLTEEQIPTKDGYIFNGYSANGNKYFDKDGKCIRAWDIEGAGQLSADWVGNPHKAIIGDNEIEVVFGEDMPTLAVIPTKDGYTFDGAYDENNVKYYNADGTSAHVWDKDEDAELTIAWKINQYTIAFDSKGGSYVEEIIQDYNTAVVEPSDPTKTGYTFAGWFADEKFTQAYEFSTMPAENVTVYAKWIAKQYSVSVGDDIITATYNEILPDVEPLSKDGYTFEGFYDEENGLGTQYIDKEGRGLIVWNKDSDDTLYPYFTLNKYTITFNLNGGSGVDSITQEYGSVIILPSDPIKNGYKFVGWDSEIPETVPAGNITISAIWSAITYTITYDLNGGTTHNPTSYTIESNAINLINPTKYGYTFAGWTGTGLDEKTFNVTIQNGSYGDRNYIANWEANKQAISDTENAVNIETDDPYGLPTNIELIVEVKTTLSDKENIDVLKIVQNKLATNEHIFKVYDVKLIRNIDGVKTEIQPSDIKSGMKIKIKIIAPKGYDINDLKIMHIHASQEIELVKNFDLQGEYIVFEVDKLSEFVFITKSMSEWTIAAIVIGSIMLICLIYLIIVLIMIIKFNKWIIDDNLNIVRAHISKKVGDNEYKVITSKLKKFVRKTAEIYDTKSEALDNFGNVEK